MIHLQLPEYHQIGEVRRWYLPLPQRASVHVVGLNDGSDVDLVDVRRDDVEIDVEYYKTTGRFVGFGSSWTDNHWGHREEFVPRGSRCNACRWFELRIFRELSDDVEVPSESTPEQLARLYANAARHDQLGDFVVYKVGMSIVPDEIPYCRYDVIASPHEVVEALTTRKHTDNGPVAFITKPSAMALASGARYDDDLEDAYVNRAVS